MIPYARHHVTEDDVGFLDAVAEKAIYNDGDLTDGDQVRAFEDDLAAVTGGHVVACNSGTAALHLALLSLGVGPGHEVVVPALTFVATAAAVVYCGARSVLCDVDPATGLATPDHVAARLSQRTKAVIGVDYAGRPCDYAGIRAALRDHLPGRHVALVADAAHALGATSLTTYPDIDAACYSFHPAKHVACGEGGAVAFRSPAHALGAASLRSHGRLPSGAWCDVLGHNYRLPELSAALGRSQLRRLREGLAYRRGLARTYDEAFADERSPVRGLYPNDTHVYPPSDDAATHARHLYVVRCPTSIDRSALRARLTARGYGTQVHYLSLTGHPVIGVDQPACSGAEEAAATYLSLPLHLRVTEDYARAVARVVVEGTDR